MQKTPEWMQDDLVKDIPAEKLEFLNILFTECKGKTKKELITYFMTMTQKAKSENLTFNKQEMNAAINAIRKYSTPEEISQINNILKKNV